MKTDRLEALYCWYLASITPDTSGEGIQYQELKSAADAVEDGHPICAEMEYNLQLPIQIPQINPRRIIGTIRVLERRGGNVSFLVLEQMDEIYHLCVKTSQFQEFYLSCDLIGTGKIDEWLIEVENRFFLSREEIEQSQTLDEVETDVLLAIFIKMEKNAKGMEPLAAAGNEPLSRWHLEFQSHEYELTVALRSRNIVHQTPMLQLPEILWHKYQGRTVPMKSPYLSMQLPEIMWHKYQGVEDYKFACRFLAARPTLEEVFSLMPFVKAISIDREEDYRIQIMDDGELYLHPADRYLGSEVAIYCQDLCLFEGRINGALKLCGTGRRIVKNAIDDLRFILREM